MIGYGVGRVSPPGDFFFEFSSKICRVLCIFIAGLPVVLKFLKCHRCPEIVLKSAIVMKFYLFGQNVLLWTFVMLSLSLIHI